ncbi:MAG TPA: hypothetical protein VJB57_11320 [Dehalococcoidia bacterium]|nr:hypothetical protein [Dehalococcoidia bacterium]
MATDHNHAAFMGYPVNCLLSIFDSPAAADLALADLLKAGFKTEDLLVLAGESGAESIDATGVEHGILARTVRLLDRLGPEFDDATTYENAAREGKYVLSIHAPSSEDRERAARVLERNGAHFANFYGLLDVVSILP